MDALVRLEDLDGLTEIQKTNIEELLELMEPIPGEEPSGIAALPISATVIDSARIRQHTSRDEMAPSDIEPGDIYVPGRIVCRSGDGVEVTPIYGWQGRQRWPVGNPIPDCWSHDMKRSGDNGMLCKECPDEPWKDGNPTDCGNVWHWIFLAEDCSELFYVLFRGKSSKTGNQLNTLTKRRPGFRLFRLFGEEETNKKGTYFLWKQSQLPEKPTPALKKLAVSLHGMISAQLRAFIAETSAPPTVEVTADVIDVPAGDSKKKVDDM